MSKQKEYGEELITEELTHLITISLADWTDGRKKLHQEFLNSQALSETQNWFFGLDFFNHSI